MKKFFAKVKGIFTRYFFNEKWRCAVCGREVFNSSAFCPDCEKTLPLNDQNICEHCGRKLKQSQIACTTCKGKMTEIDLARSAFDYAEPITNLIHKAKYYGEKYILKIFSEYLALFYYKYYFNADLITFIPMTKKSERKRGYNQSKLLAEHLSKKIGVPVFYGVEKKKETIRQAKLNKSDRLKNLEDAFKVKGLKELRDKKVLIVDDVTTTGATARAMAIKLRRKHVKQVFLLTVASVAPKEKY